MLLYCVHHLMCLKTRRFGNWTCFRPQVKWWGTQSAGPVRKS